MDRKERIQVEWNYIGGGTAQRAYFDSAKDATRTMNWIVQNAPFPMVGVTMKEERTGYHVPYIMPLRRLNGGK